jgi:hypothetical protein
MSKAANIFFFSLAMMGQIGLSQAQTYYVDNLNGDDSWDGTQPQYVSAGIGPWRSVERVNQSTLNAGDTVKFAKGGIWREALVIPSSGASDELPITFTSFDTDTNQVDAPVISCANDVTNLMWEGVIANGGFEYTDPEQANTVFPGWVGSSNVLQFSPGYDSAYAMYGSSGTTSVKTVALHMEEGVNYEISGVLRGGGGSSRVEVELYMSAPSTLYLDANGEWVPWYPHQEPPVDVEPFEITTDVQWKTFSKAFVGKGSETVYIRVTTIGQGWADDIKLIKNGVDYWTTHWAELAPEILIEDGERIAWGAEWDESRAWHRATGASRYVRYIPAPGTAPDDYVLEMGARRIGILLEDRDYVVIDGLMVTGCGGVPGGSAGLGGVGIQMHKGSSHNIVKNITLSNNRQGIQMFGKSDTNEFNTDNLIDNVEVHDSIQKGIAVQSESSDIVIRDSVVANMSRVASDNVTEDKEAISIGGNTGNGGNITVENNTLSNIGPDFVGSTGSGITVFNSPGTIVRYNTLTDIGRHGIAFGTNNKSPHGFNIDGGRIYGNVVQRSGVSPGTGAGMAGNVGTGIGFGSDTYSNVDDMRIYNNTVLDCELNDNKDGGIAIKGVANADGTVNRITNAKIYNNVIAGCTGAYPHAIYYGDPAIIEIDLASFESNNNVFYPGSGVGPEIRFVVFNGTAYKLQNFGLYQAASNQDAASMVIDPLLEESAAGDYKPTANSLLVDNAGSGNPGELPYATDRDGKPIVGARDIGALEFGTRGTGDMAGIGSVLGDYSATHFSDNDYESIQEVVLSFRADGNPHVNDSSHLSHTWTLDVAGAGVANLVFAVEAHHSGNAEGDDFVFAYSTDNVNFTDLMTVTKTADDGTVQTAILPPGTDGTLYIRVQDADRTNKNSALDTLYVDQLYVTVQ